MKTTVQRFWRITKKVMLVLLALQLILFFVIIIPEFQLRWDDMAPVLLRLGLLAAVVILFIIAYYKWLYKINFLRVVITTGTRIFFVLYFLQWLYILFCWVFNPPITLTQTGSLLGGYGLHRDYVPYDRISPWMKLAVIASEDQNFPDHDGFDIKSIKLAMKYNKKHPNKTRGASTISQQTAKNIFLWQGRNFVRKGLEVYFTFMIESLWSKRTILERYLNVIEMGKGIFGVQAAAKAYFNKDAKDLTRLEAAQIAACLPNPKLYSVKPLGNYVAGRANDILRQMSFLEPDPDIQEIIR